MGLSNGLLLLLCLIAPALSSSSSDEQDAAALRALMEQMKNMPPSWGKTNNPCDTPWEGITCNNSRVTELKLYNMGIEGTLSSDIGSLTEIKILDFSYNKNLGGPLTRAIGKLKQLTALFLVECSFSGNIPDELGDLPRLQYLSLTSNKFVGNIPASLGKLSQLFLLDVADNQLTGPLPISTDTAPGLDQLVTANHFHFNKNQLSGPIPEKLFSSNLTLVHVLFDRNRFNGTLPDSIGLVQSLQILRLDKNSLSGSIPFNINNLPNLIVLNLANNKFTGPMPNLTALTALNSVDLSNNSFDPSVAPAWISNLDNLRSLVIESGGLYGEVPEILFSFQKLQQVILNNNAFNGSLNMGSNISMHLKFVNFQNNALSSVELSTSYNTTIILAGNPVCRNFQLSETSYCLPQLQTVASYSISKTNCSSISCPQSYMCSHPYEGEMIFRAPFFRDVTNHSAFEDLENSLWDKFGSHLTSVSVQNPFFDGDFYLIVDLKFCPLSGSYFNRTEILIGIDLSNQNYGTPPIFGPNYFSAYPYDLQGGQYRSSTGLTVGFAVCGAFLLLGLVSMGIYAMWQKKRAQRAIEANNPFASWVCSGEDSVEAPQLKGARLFSYDELKKCTNNFPEINVIGCGGYGKVYRGMLSDGQRVAIKRAQVGSNQGGLEFKTEIELLSRIHHKNLVELVGFCFHQGEGILVYEFIRNGTLRECLSGESGMQLNWRSRISIALDAAKGLAYLHEHANPPIIHRDIKSTNLLLDENFTAKVADFGLSKLVANSDIGHFSTEIKGTLGYLDPEYYTTQMLTGKSDVYSFGVVMLELVAARPPIHKGKYIVREVRMAVNNKDEEYYGLKEIMDPVIRDETDLIGFRRFVQLALQCTEESSAGRPTMSDIVKEIETMMRNEGVNDNALSANSVLSSSFATDPLPTGDAISNSFKYSGGFDYSGGYSFSTEIRPK